MPTRLGARRGESREHTRWSPAPDPAGVASPAALTLSSGLGAGLQVDYQVFVLEHPRDTPEHMREGTRDWLPGLDRDELARVLVGDRPVPACVAHCSRQVDAERIQKALEELGFEAAVAEEGQTLGERARGVWDALRRLREPGALRRLLSGDPSGDGSITDVEARRRAIRFVGRVLLGCAIPLTLIGLWWLCTVSWLAARVVPGLVLGVVAGVGSWLGSDKLKRRVRLTLLTALAVGASGWVLVQLLPDPGSRHHEPGGRKGLPTGSSSSLSLDKLEIAGGSGGGGADEPEAAAGGPFATFASELPQAPSCDPEAKPFASLWCRIQAMTGEEAPTEGGDLDALADGLETTDAVGGSSNTERLGGRKGGGRARPGGGRLGQRGGESGGLSRSGSDERAGSEAAAEAEQEPSEEPHRGHRRPG